MRAKVTTHVLLGRKSLGCHDFGHRGFFVVGRNNDGKQRLVVGWSIHSEFSLWNWTFT
jgi:hypothetical protein